MASLKENSITDKSVMPALRQQSFTDHHREVPITIGRELNKVGTTGPTIQLAIKTWLLRNKKNWLSACYYRR